MKSSWKVLLTYTKYEGQSNTYIMFFFFQISNVIKIVTDYGIGNIHRCIFACSSKKKTKTRYTFYITQCIQFWQCLPWQFLHGNNKTHETLTNVRATCTIISNKKFTQFCNISIKIHPISQNFVLRNTVQGI